MKKMYLKPRVKTLDVMSEEVLNMTSVNDNVGDGNQLGKENGFDESDDYMRIKRTNVWE